MDKQKMVIIGVAAAAAAWIGALLVRFSITSTGKPNTWTLGAVINILRVAAHIDAARVAINGRLSSVFRSPEVNASLSNASATSRHMEGLAADIVPGSPYGVPDAAHKIATLARQGTLGPVRTVIQEPTWVHVDWYRADEPAGKIATRRAVGSGASTTYVSAEF